MRRCVGCGTQKSKKELVRVLRTPEGSIVIDATGRANGRGAYLCPDPACLAKAVRSKALEHSLETPIPQEITEALQAQLAAVHDQPEEGSGQ